MSRARSVTVARSRRHHDEDHVGPRAQRLRAGVLGANDGIVSVAGLVMGVAGGTSDRQTIFLAGFAGLVSGALSMAAGEYVSVSTQRDTEKALIAKERRELAEEPEEELAELAGIYRDKGLSDELALQVAHELTAHDALAAHADAELNIDPDELTSPVQAATASMIAFTLGGLLPLLTITLLPQDIRIVGTVAAVVSFLPADGADAWRDRLAAAGVTGHAVDLVPRISRAQSMDALTSQSMVAGYRAAIVAAELLRDFLPLTMTAAGTLPAARILVLGAGVAGLQAIATARGLGALVQAYDVRASSAEEVASLGAEALDLGLPPLDGVAGYAREMAADRAAEQQRRLAPYVAAVDALITTAAVPGRPAPVLVSRAMVAAMRPGSVVVDIAADSGGNVEGVVPGETVRVAGAEGEVLLWGGADVPAQMPAPASRLYAGNLVAFATLLLTASPDDEILAATRVTRG